MASTSTAAPAHAGINLTANYDKARNEYEAAQAAMLRQAEDLERIQKELRRAQQAVLERERALVEAALKDGVTATTATAAMVALNPATAAKVGMGAVGAGQKVAVAALGWKQHLIAGGVARGVAVTSPASPACGLVHGPVGHRPRMHACVLEAPQERAFVQVGSLFPVDSVKTKLQVGQKVQFRLDTIGHDHFKGFGSAMLGQIPYGMLVFGTYETLKNKVFARKPEWNESFATKIPVFIGCAVVGDTVGAIWLTPSEIVKQRLQSGAASSTSEAIKSIYAKNGLRGFYTGFSGLLARDVPYRAMQLPLYEVARDAYSQKYCAPFDRTIFPHEAMMVGATVGMISAGITTPLDVVKSRMMVGTAAGKTVGGVIKDIYKEAGVGGLFKGVKQCVLGH
jgi:solute carrier family 25 S-adenosylmethionine transporter 26